MSVIRRLQALSLVCVAACSASPDPAGTEKADIGVTLNHAPDAIDCIAFTLANSDGTSQVYAFAIATRIKISDVTVGAYELSAVAFKSSLPDPVTDAQCAAVPASSDWTTETAVPVAVMRNANTQINLTLVRAGTITVKSTFVEVPEVVASGQGPVGPIAANGSVGNAPFVAWGVNNPNHMGQIVRMIDGQAPPLGLTSGLVNISEVKLDPDSNTIYWDDGRSGATDADGHFVNDGAIFSIPARPPASGLFPGDIGFATGDHHLYWSEVTTSSIDCLGCAAPVAENEVSPNAFTANGNRLYWNAAGGPTDLVRGMTLGDPAPTTLLDLGAVQAYGMAADDDFVYWIDFDTTTGAIDDSRIVELPAGGGVPLVLVPDTLSAFPLVAYKGNVFYLDANGVHSVSSGGGDPVDVVASGTVGGFAITSDQNGHDVIYWTDTSHGGLVWRGRLD